MYFGALQSVLIKGLRFVVRPCFFYKTKTLSKTWILHRVKSSERYRIFRGPTKRFSKRLRFVVKPYFFYKKMTLPVMSKLRQFTWVFFSFFGGSSFSGRRFCRFWVFTFFFRYPRRFTWVTISTLLVLHVLQSLGEKWLLLPSPPFQDSICQFRIVSSYWIMLSSEDGGELNKKKHC